MTKRISSARRVLPTIDYTKLISQINGGKAQVALAQIKLLLGSNRKNAILLLLQAEAFRISDRVDEAIDGFIESANMGAGWDAWHRAGVLLAHEQRIQKAIECFTKALATSANDNDIVLDAIITTLFNAGLHSQGVPYARLQSSRSANPEFCSRAAQLLSMCGFNDEATAVFRKILQLAADQLSPSVLGPALTVIRFTCDWSLTQIVQRQILAHYSRGDFLSTKEYPLTNITWCANEAFNLEVAKASYFPTLSPSISRAVEMNGQGKIRVGYVSCDFKNHATMHLMAGLFEAHNKSVFEIYAYDHSIDDGSEYRQRFLSSIDHHVDIRALTDEAAAFRIAQDGIDVLIDLKGHTGLNRLNIFSYRPAKIQASYLGFPGSAGCSWIDYIISDRYVTPDSSIEFYAEKLCRLPYSYQCNDRLRPHPALASSRLNANLPEDKVVFCAFNQSYKIDEMSFLVWMEILHAVPDSVLWLMANDSESAKKNLSDVAMKKGVPSERLIFAPFAPPMEHLARIRLADAALDTLVCNGHTTTSDALWMGVPVITSKGFHFASRVSESLLNAMDLPELVGENPESMIEIASRIGLDREYRKQIQEKVVRNRLTTPLFNTEQFTVNFEVAIKMMLNNFAMGQAPRALDVPDSYIARS